jgi:hypothetical protein
MDNSISAFNEMVVHLRERKMSVIRDYKYFNLDVALINHELTIQK